MKNVDVIVLPATFYFLHQTKSSGNVIMQSVTNRNQTNHQGHVKDYYF